LWCFSLFRGLLDHSRISEPNFFVWEEGLEFKPENLQFPWKYMRKQDYTRY